MKIRKLLLSLVLVFVATLTVSAKLITTTGTKPSVGNGNSGNPYEIRTAEELRWFVHYENTRHWFPNDHAKLMADIDLSSICGPDKGSWIPLGSFEEEGADGYYYGDFDGNGHTISGIYVDGSQTTYCDSYPGFFGYVAGAKIHDLTIEGDIVHVACYTGGLIAYVHTDVTSKSTKISNCEVKMNLYLENILKEGEGEPYFAQRGWCIGGLVGFWNEYGAIGIDNCTFNGTINFNKLGLSSIGGLIGVSASGFNFDIVNCVAYTGKGYPFIAFVQDYSGTMKKKVQNCISDGPIFGEVSFIKSSRPKLIGNIYGGDKGICDTLRTLKSDGGFEYGDVNTNRNVSAESFENGFACYAMNEEMRGQYYTQTLGTDRAPCANRKHATVYRVKRYTKCGTDNWEWVYSNTDEDDETLRNHVFDADHAYCTNCGEAVNPDYNAEYADGYYLLSSADDVKWFWNLVNVSGKKEAKMRLTADIDMEGELMEPLKKFYGTIDGQGHTLANIHIKCSGVSSVGLVGNLYPHSCIKNLALTGTVEATNPSDMGAFAGKVWTGATISNVLNGCTVKATGKVDGFSMMNIGGIAGYVQDNTSKVTDCINNGAVVDATTSSSGTPIVNIGGVIGWVYNNKAVLRNLVNNGVVGSFNNTLDGFSKGAAVVNFEYTPTTAPTMYYVSGITNPGMKSFVSDTQWSGTAVSAIDLGSGSLAWQLAGKDYSADDANTAYWGQTIGTDYVPYPFVNEAHQGVYNTRHYYTCSDYTDYNNSPVDGEPGAHSWTDGHYCSLCCAIDAVRVPKDAATGVYQISTPEQYNIFASAVNATNAASKPTKYASASILEDLDFTSVGLVSIDCLYGHLHGCGHRITFGSTDDAHYMADVVDKDGVIDYLNVVLGSESATPRQLCNACHGQIVGCNVKGGVPAKTSDGIVQRCTGETGSDYTPDGRFADCLFQVFSDGEAVCYRLYNTSSGEAGYEEYALGMAETGELAYMLSHRSDSQNEEWGQALGDDAAPRIYYGQTPASSTYVTSLTTYSVVNPDGKVEYMNAGMALEAAPGYFKVCQDTESWTARPAYNFIVDNGDGTYSAEHINIDPTVQNYLPMEVQAARLTFKETDSEGELVGKTYSRDEVVSLVFPVEMAVSNINGIVYLFDGYDATTNNLVFTSSLDYDCIVPAGTPMLVKAFGGSILHDDLTSVCVRPMTEAGRGELENVRHLVGYQQQTLPMGKTIEDGGYVLYYAMSGDKAVLSKESALTASQFCSYFRLPYISYVATKKEIDVILTDSREIKTSSLIERDLFSIPYGAIDDSAEWHKVSHLSDKNVFYGNDINKDNYANISAYDFLYIHGKAGQKYQFYFNGSDATEVEIDQDGDAFIDLNDHRVGIGDVYLRGIRLAEGETVADDAFAKVYKYLEEGLVLYGYGDFSDDLKGYLFYDATGVKCGITLNLDNPNAMVVGGSNVKGVYNRIVKSEDVMQGFTAEKLRLTDGGDFCYDYSVKCPDVTFTRYDIPEQTRYVTFVLPFAVNYVKGMHEYIDCDGKNVYFNTPEDGVIDAYLPIVIDMEEYEGNAITITGEDFVALSPNGTFNVAPAPSSQYDLRYGFVKRQQQDVPLTNEEVADYNVYGFSTKSYKFVRATETFSVSPFRAFFMLPKSTAARAKGFAAPEAEVEALDIVLDGEEITTGIVDVDFDFDRQNKRYNLLGQPVGSDYKGIVIKNNKKTIVK